MALTGAAAAHSVGITGQGVAIGVVDSGVNRNHPALQGRVPHNLVYISSSSNNLTVDDVVGHGTAVAQIMAGRAFGEWPGGIAPGASIISARIISDKPPVDDGSGQGNEVSGALGLKPIHQDLIDRGARVMNNSWGGLYWTNLNATAPIADEYRPFILANNGLVVFATGNSGFANPSDTAALPSKAGPGGTLPAADLERGWLAVAALDTDNPSQLASYSNACGIAMRYCLVAPGNVVATGTNDSPTNPTYWNWKGTSFAAPQVSGAAALVWQAFPYFNNDLVRQTLLGTARDVGTSGVDATFGYGLLDVGKAIGGPGRFDWGDVTVSFNGTSRWSNPTEGAGGLVKQGSGTLVLGAATQYTGATRVEGGVLSVEGGLNGTRSTTILPGAQLQLRNQAGMRGDVVNNGTFAAYSAQNHSINGNYVQAANARLAIEIGTSLYALGTASLNDGELHVLGNAPGYVASTTRRETFLTASGGLNGTFGSLTAAPGVFLQATLGYDAVNAWLNISRLEVTTAAQAMGLSAQSLGSAVRLEQLFDDLDRRTDERIESSTGKTSADLIRAAGVIQHAATAAAAERTLSSLSGDLHTADTAFAIMAIEGNRHALESRLAGWHGATMGGAWAEDLNAQRAVSGFDVEANGWMLGQDRRVGDWMLGAAFGHSAGRASHALRNDRERNRQTEGQIYAAWNRDGNYLLGRGAAGRMDRRMQREVLLGSDRFTAESDYADRYTTLAIHAGRQFDAGAASVTPYVGLQALQLERGRFAENGAMGFGLAARGSSLSATQAMLGARVAHDWRLGATRMRITGRMEWQRTLSQSGADIEARFAALDVWSPIVGQGLDRDVGVLGLELGWQLPFGRLGFDLDGRHEHGQAWTQARASWSTSF
ncbi:S8 family serine peptidase [Lysobacter koreensis]|uniref:S8 family serine peptidase n=1 Tax=Lysobacter koreensis TaxID=266122 RepID=A0ABW2YLI4_9GAMM